MSGDSAPAARIVRGAAAVAATVLAGSSWIWGAGPAVAGTSHLTLQYTCDFPVLNTQPMTASMDWSSPDSVVVGQATPQLAIQASATVSGSVVASLGLLGVKTVDGSADASAVVAAPEGSLPVTVQLRVPKTYVPASGAMTVDTEGTTPALTFKQPGTAKISVGAVTLHLTPRSATGATTIFGTVNVTCQLVPGQNTVLTTFQVAPAAGPAPSATTTTTTPPAGSGPGSSPAPGGGQASAGSSGSPSPSPGGPAAPSGATTSAGSAATSAGTPGAGGTAGSAATTAASSAAASGPAPTGGATAAAVPVATALASKSAGGGSGGTTLALIAAGILAAGIAAFGGSWWLKRRGPAGGGGAD